MCVCVWYGSVYFSQSADFFRADNANASHMRQTVALDVLDEVLKWLRDGGQGM